MQGCAVDCVFRRCEWPEISLASLQLAWDGPILSRKMHRMKDKSPESRSFDLSLEDNRAIQQSGNQDLYRSYPASRRQRQGHALGGDRQVILARHSGRRFAAMLDRGRRPGHAGKWRI